MTKDGLGSAIKSEAADSSGTVQSVTDTVYTPYACVPFGIMSQQSQPHAPNGSVYWTTYSYDGIGRMLNSISPDGASTTTYSYAGNTVTVTDPAGKWKKFTMDGFGNISSVVEPDATQTNTSGQATTTYTYDALNHLIQISMPRQTPGGTVTQTRTFNYNSGSTITAYLQSATNPENGTVSYTYNADGTVATKTDARFQILTYSYDSMGRLQQVSNPSGYGALRTYYYDSNPFIPGYSQYVAGRLAAIQYNYFANTDTVTEMYSYAQPGAVAGKRLNISRPYGGNQTATGDLIAAYGHDSEGRLTSVAYPAGGPTYSYSYDSMGRLSQMTDQLNNVRVNNLQYNPAGQFQQISFFGATETRQYNSAQQVTQLTVANGGTVLNMQYGYSANQNNGQITSQTDLISGEQINYAYDSLKRLVSAITTGQTWGQGYNYDPFGNLTAKTVLYGSVPTMSVGVDATTNRLVGLSYDANGSPLNDPFAGGLTYDVENRVSSASPSGGPYQFYGYDADNKRIWTKSNPGAESYNFYGPDGQQLGQYTPTINGYQLTFSSTSIRVYFGGKLVSQDGTNPMIQDRLGSLRVDASGNKTGFYPYGEDKGAPAANGQVKFATYTRDSGTSTDYADQRYYGWNYGRFLTPDPYMGRARAARPQSWNRYAYVVGDPVNSTDPLGLDAFNGYPTGCGVSFSGNQTGPPSNCNSVGYAAWSLGIDTYTTPPSAGFSQTPTITQVDIAAAEENAWAVAVNSAFYLAVANANTNYVQVIVSFSGGSINAMENPDPATAELIEQYNPGAVLVTDVYGNFWLIIPDSTSLFSGQPPPSMGSVLTLPFAPTNTATCSAGYHPQSLPFIPDVWLCAPNGVGPSSPPFQPGPRAPEKPGSPTVEPPVHRPERP